MKTISACKRTIFCVVSICFFLLYADFSFAANPQLISSTASIGPVKTIRLVKALSLSEIILKAGFSISDADVAPFLSDFMLLNDKVTSISLINKGTVVRLPLKYLKSGAHDQAQTAGPETSTVSAKKPGSTSPEPVRSFTALKTRKRNIRISPSEKSHGEMILRNIERLAAELQAQISVDRSGLKIFTTGHRSEIRLDKSNFPLVTVNNRRVLGLDLSGEFPPELADALEFSWPEYKIIHLSGAGDLKKIVGIVLDLSDYQVMSGKHISTGGATQIGYDADFIVMKKGSDIFEGELTAIGIVDYSGLSTPEELISWFRKNDIRLIELSAQKPSREKRFEARFTEFPAVTDTAGFAETAMKLMGYRVAGKKTFRLENNRAFSYKLDADLSVKVKHRTKVVELSDISHEEIVYARTRGYDIISIADTDDRNVILQRIYSLFELPYKTINRSTSSHVSPRVSKYRLTLPGYLVYTSHGVLLMTDSELDRDILRKSVDREISIVRF